VCNALSIYLVESTFVSIKITHRKYAVIELAGKLAGCHKKEVYETGKAGTV
jgi:hypothetical protein